MCGGKGGRAYDISLSREGLGVWSLQERHESAGWRPCKGYEAMWVWGWWVWGGGKLKNDRCEGSATRGDGAEGGGGRGGGFWAEKGGLS